MARNSASGTWASSEGLDEIRPEPSELPRVLCLELTSRCQLSCVFCTRSRFRGAGQHMPFELLESILRQAGTPERVFLNCCGESMHYPRLGDAIRRAKSTGAETELISTLCTAPEELVRAALEAGLDYLHVSLHTMSPESFKRIYRASSLAAMQSAIERFLDLRERVHASTALDFAFVALDRNLEDLAGVVAYADRIGVQRVSVLALSQPEDSRHEFAAELEGGWLSPSFRRRLGEAIDQARLRYPGVEVQAPDLGDLPLLDGTPRSYPAPLPDGAHIASCGGDPWETLTVLASGDVPACGEDGMEPLGHAASQILREIWHGERFQAFRRGYLRAEHPICRVCPCKMAYLPAPLRPTVSAASESAQLVRGWFGPEEGGIRWSHQEAVLALPAPPPGYGVRITGLLPAGKGAEPNRLQVSLAGVLVGEIVNQTGETQSFDSTFALPPSGSGVRQLLMRTSSVLVPRRRGTGSDVRQLGFALIRAELGPLP